MLTLHEFTADRSGQIAAMLCDADRAELEAAGLEDPAGMLRQALPLCRWVNEARWCGKPLAVYGVRSLSPAVGVPWMLTTTAIDEAHRATVARAAVRAVRRMRQEFPMLANQVHAANREAIAFVQWLGFVVHPQPCGRNGAFRAFEWWADHV